MFKGKSKKHKLSIFVIIIVLILLTTAAAAVAAMDEEVGENPIKGINENYSQVLLTGEKYALNTDMESHYEEEKEPEDGEITEDTEMEELEESELEEPEPEEPKPEEPEPEEPKPEEPEPEVPEEKDDEEIEEDWEDEIIETEDSDDIQAEEIIEDDQSEDMGDIDDENDYDSPIVPVWPDETEEPVEPEYPIEPDEPEEPEELEYPIEPIEPDDPNEPEEPEEPEEPIEPEEPDGPIMPVEPEEPEEPEEPDNPDEPEVDMTPVVLTDLKNGDMVEGTRLTFNLEAKDYKGRNIESTNFSVYVNGVIIYSSGENIYKRTYRANLIDGDNQIIITVKDTYGNSISKLYSVSCNTEGEIEVGGTARIIVDASSVGLGILLDVEQEFYEGDGVSHVVNKALTNNGFKVESKGTHDYGWYLSRISKTGMMGDKEPQIAEDVQRELEEKGRSWNGYDMDELGESDFYQYSGWVYTHNGESPNTGMASRHIGDGDTITLTFILDLNY